MVFGCLKLNLRNFTRLPTNSDITHTEILKVSFSWKEKTWVIVFPIIMRLEMNDKYFRGKNPDCYIPKLKNWDSLLFRKLRAHTHVQQLGPHESGICRQSLKLLKV